MEPPLAPPPLSSAAATATATAYPDSVDSSPRNTDSWDEPSIHGGAGSTSAAVKLRFMCSYGGHIVPRPHDKSLCYVGGDTRIVVVDRHATLSELVDRLSRTLFSNRSSSFTLKYQLPNEDLDSLISVTTDEDLENMIEEYDRLNSEASGNNKSSRLRLFLFPNKPESGSSIGSILESSTKSEDWFLNALNGATSGFSDTSSVNCLLGLDDDVSVPEKAKDSKSIGGGGGGSGKNLGQDVHSVPDSPMLETTSSFGSASSSLANLPPIRVHVEDQKAGIEDQFSQMILQQKQEEGGFVGLPNVNIPAVPVVSGVPLNSNATTIGEFPNRVFVDDERFELGVQMGYAKPPLQQQQTNPQLQLQTMTQEQPQPQPQLPSQFVPPQLQQKQPAGVDLASPDSVSSDGSVSNPLSRQRPTIYQDPTAQIPSINNRVSANPSDSKPSDPNARIPIQPQIQESGYLLPTQFEPQHSQLHHPQFIHSNSQYIHHHPSGALPLGAYYQLYPSQQSHHPHHAALDQQNFVYYLPARPPQGYNLSLQPPSYGEASNAPSTRAQMPPPPSGAYTNIARSTPVPQSELPAGVYRTANSGVTQLVQMPSSQNQPQYIGYSQIHHPSQTVVPTSGATANFGYDFADSVQGHNVYYAQPFASQPPAQYQTMATNLPEASSQIVADGIKQQARTSQP